MPSPRVQGLLYNNAGFLAVPNVDVAFDAKTLTEYRRLQEVAREFGRQHRTKLD